MEAAQYPAKKCREPIFGVSGIGYACELPNMHMGPHATFSDAYSVRTRDAWETANPEKVGTSDLDGDIILDRHGKPTT